MVTDHFVYNKFVNDTRIGKLAISTFKKLPEQTEIKIFKVFLLILYV